MRVIGAGFGRTGTYSLREALVELGFGPCYHMTELFHNPSRIQLWRRAARGEPLDWDSLLGGYQSTVDWPGCYFWKDLVDAYPDAKVILTVREPRTWYFSAKNTVYSMQTRPSLAEPAAAMTKIARRLTPELRDIGKLSAELVWDGTFNGRFEDEQYAIEVFERHIQEVVDYVSSDRLLVYEPGSGWQPLCDFLHVAVPNRDFPSGNASDGFHALLRGKMRARLLRSLAWGVGGAISVLAAAAAARRRW